MIPGMYPAMVNTMFNQKCNPNPTWKKTPSGGKTMARMIRITSFGPSAVFVDALILFFYF